MRGRLWALGLWEEEKRLSTRANVCVSGTG